jgi:NAD(P)-dependent dehydrogenase (short-subunit alcohol dehydrogenase family)
MTTVGVITGAASGMGRACLERLRGTVDALLAVDLEAPAIDGAEGVACDVRDAVAVEALAGRVRELGTFRTLVHAAGISPMMGDARTIVDVNLVGTARILDAFEPLVVPGSVAVPFSSSAGYLPLALLGDELTGLVGQPRTADFLDRAAPLLPDTGMAYSYSKVGVQLEARKAAVRWAPLGGRVVSLSPGSIDTPMGRLELENQPVMRDMLDAHPMARLGGAGEIAAVVAFICSDDASFLSGIDVLVDGAEQAKQMTATQG